MLKQVTGFPRINPKKNSTILESSQVEPVALSVEYFINFRKIFKTCITRSNLFFSQAYEKALVLVLALLIFSIQAYSRAKRKWQY